MLKPLILAGMLTLSVSLQAAPTVYVAPTGSDAAPGTREHPVYSLSAAYELARQSSDSTTVLIAPGTYLMPRPLTVTAENAPQAPVCFRSLTDEKPVFVGGIPIRDWKPWQNGIWRTRVPQLARFDQLYVEGRHATRARTPNVGYFMVRDGGETVIERGEDRMATYATQKITVHEADLASLRGMAPDELNRVTALFYHKWDVTRKPVEHMIADSGYLFFSGEGMKPWNPIGAGTRYVLDNYLGALDAPGEWYLADDGWLYYMPREGEDMQTLTCYAPLLGQLVEIYGTPQKPVTNLTFDNLSFQVTGYAMPLKGSEAMQAAAYVPAAVQADFARHITLRNCDIGQTGGYAVWWRRECFDNTIRHCHIQQLGAGGVKIGEWVTRINHRPVTARNIVDNNIIQHGDYVFPCGVGVGIFHAAHNRVTHNDIGDLRYSGISVGWKWGYNDAEYKMAFIDSTEQSRMEVASYPSPAVGNIIAFNHVHHIGWAELSDMGAVYTLGESPGTVVRNNLIHDVYSYDYGGWGLYTDEGSTGIVMENNLVYRCKSGAFHQHYGRENVIRNNILGMCYLYQLQFTRVEPHKSFDFRHNMVVMDRGILMAGAWGDARIDMDYNCYWDLRGADSLRVGAGSLAQWKKEQKRDRHSIAANPLFRNPAAGDFTFVDLKTARRIGFKPFDYTQAGVYGSETWKAEAKLPLAVTTAFDRVVAAREAQP